MQKSVLSAVIIGLAVLSSFAQTQEVGFRDVIINEFMCRPSPPQGLPNREFVELYNRTDRTINLTGWTIKDESTVVGTFPEISLEPGEYGIVCRASHAAEFAPFGKVIAASTLAVLNQGGDSITIRTADGFIVDALYYTDAWYKDPEKRNGGFTIELINPDLNCSGEFNWRASDSPLGGTPGTENSVIDRTPDLEPPVLQNVSQPSPDLIRLTFNKGMDEETVSNPSLYILSPSIDISTINLNVDKTVVEIQLASPIQGGQIYELTLIGLIDCEGNEFAQRTVQLASGRSPEFNEVIVTELMSNPNPPVGLPNEEYLELYNTTDDVIDLAGVRLRSNTRSAVFTEGILFPQSYALVVADRNAGLYPMAENIITVPTLPQLTIAGADVSLELPDERTVFHIRYSDTWISGSFKRNGGWSLEMIDKRFPCAGRQNWEASVDPSGGTPGLPNSIADELNIEDIPIPVAVELLTEQSIRVRFSSKIDPGSVNPEVFFIEPSVTVTSAIADGPVNSSVTLELAQELAPSTIYRLKATGVTNCAGEETDTAAVEFGLPELVMVGDIVINELLYDPLTGGVDFVEIWNISDKILTLSDMSIVREDGNNDIVTLASMAEINRLLMPGTYIVLSSNGEIVRSQYSSPGPGAFADVPGFPNYVNAGGVVALYRQDFTVLDRFPYDPRLHFRLLRDTKGVSLERINPDKSSDDRGNWNSAALSLGGATPGRQNSNFLIPSIKGSLTLSPEVFSPDQDGFDDILSVAYSLEKPGYQGSVSIFTVEGIPVRKLVNAETLAQEGFFTWDGLDDNEQRARVGIYVVVLEVFDTEGNRDIFRAKCVLANRLR